MAQHLYTANSEIRRVMQKHDISQRTLAAKMGVSQGRLNKMLQQELNADDNARVLSHIHAIA